MEYKRISSTSESSTILTLGDKHKAPRYEYLFVDATSKESYTAYRECFRQINECNESGGLRREKLKTSQLIPKISNVYC